MTISESDLTRAAVAFADDRRLRNLSYLPLPEIEASLRLAFSAVLGDPGPTRAESATSKTTLYDRRPVAVICRERGWTAGTRIVGDEGYGPTVLQITAVGEKSILAKVVTHGGVVPEWAGREGEWCLSMRDWREVT